MKKLIDDYLDKDAEYRGLFIQAISVLEWSLDGFISNFFCKKNHSSLMWKLPPFMNMNENTVFLIVAALANNIFRAMVMLFKKDVPQLRLNARLKEFQYIFINVAFAFINDQFVFYEEDILYDKLMI